MKVLSFSPVPLWDFGDKKGMPSIFLGQKGFADAGHDVWYLFPGRANRSYDQDGIHMIEFRLPFPRVSPRKLWLHRISERIYGALFVVAAAAVGLYHARRIRPQVIYGHFPLGALAGWTVAALYDVPYVTRLYGTFLFPWVHSFWGRLRKWDEVLAFKLPCRFLIVTNDGTQGDRCAAALNVPPERLRFWRNGVEKDLCEGPSDAENLRSALALPEGAKVLLSVSRLTGWKHVERLITALPDVLKEVPNACAVLVGDGEERPHLEALCRELGVCEHVRFAGAVPHAEVALYYRIADVFVSLYELSNLGNPLLEAMCCGRAIVTLNNGGTGDVIRNNQNGILLEENEIGLLPGTLVRLLQEDGLRERLANSARAFAREHLQTWTERIRMEVRLIEGLA
jgi:glycosyltransferase involved in cell wall biosynthesis